MRKKGIKVASKIKLATAKAIVNGTAGASASAKQLGLSEQTVRYWAALYRAQGESAFENTGKNKVYQKSLKDEAVQSYLRGEGSYETIAAKYGLRSDRQLKVWVKMYNNGKDFSHKMSGGSRMTTARKTTKEERIRIVKDCLANKCNYGETAVKYNVSYQQVYTWVKRFRELGEEGLDDRRGKRKAAQEPRSEMERLQIELEQLKHKLYMTEMERDLLKKVRELERKDLYRK